MKILLTLIMLATLTAAFQAIPMKFHIRKGATPQSSTKQVGSHSERLFKREIATVGKRATDGTAAIDIVDQTTYYAINVTIGGEEFEVILDTGSSDLWVFDSSNPYCDSTSSSSKERVFKLDAADILAKDVNRSPDPKLLPPLNKRAYYSDEFDGDTTTVFDTPISATTTFQSGFGSADPAADETPSIPAALATIDCDAFGTLDTSSDAFSATDDLFLLQYGDTTFALGLYGTGDITFGELTVKDFTFAVANRSNSTLSVFGVGLAGNEASTQDSMEEYSPNGAFQYDNLPLALKKQGTIGSAVFSLFMDQESSDGTILFGGIDHAKYSGDLETLPLLNYYEQYGISSPITFDIELQGATISTDSESSSILSQSISVLLDSGTSFTYLPSSMVESIMYNIGAQYDSSSGYYLVNCPSSTTGIEINFNFGNITISIPIEDALVPADESYETCAVVILPSADRYILGDTFLRSAYVFYDLENLEVQIAQYKSSTDSDVEVVGSNGASFRSGSTTKATSSAAESSREISSTNTPASAQSTSDSGDLSSASTEASETDGGSSEAPSGSATAASSTDNDSSSSNVSDSTNFGNSMSVWSTPSLIIAALMAMI